MRKGSHHPEETKRKISESLMGKYAGEKSSNYGKHLSEETRRKISLNHADVSGKNNPMYGVHRFGKNNPMYGVHRFGKDAPMYGKHHSDETKRKISEGLKGKKNGSWIDGRSNLPYAFNFNKELKELIKKRDEYMCQFPDCGTDIDLTVHHVDYDKFNGNPINLITLCRGHNSKVNGNREHWTEYFKEQMGVI